MTADGIGGVWTYAMELARAVGRYDVEIVLATMGEPLTADQRAEAGALPHVHLVESDFKLEWMNDPWDDVERAGEWLLALEADFHPDIVHLNGYAHAALPWCGAVLIVAHSCVLSWWRAVKGEDAPPDWTRYRDEVARGLRSAELVVAPSKAMLALLDEHYGGTAAARVIPNARDPDGFAPGAKETFILSAGRLWDEAKNVAALEAIAHELSWPAYIAGDGRGVVGSAASEDGARHLGRLSARELASWMARASIFALPVRYEPFGLSALEAALAGCALVLGDIPSQREIWDHAAVFVPPNDPSALRSALERLISDDVHRRQLALRARRRALDYNPRRLGADYMTAYTDLLMRPAKLRENAACAS